jgi:pantetheine-phosphate adenylyltransferase
MAKVAVYAGSFDPVTLGHLDILKRAAAQFDKVIVSVSDNPRKKPTFTAAERVKLWKSCKLPGNVELDSFSGLLADYMRKKGATVAIRGLRAVIDLEYEFQMASMNRRMFPELETVFMMPAEEYTYLSSSIVREIAALGGSLKGLVAESVEIALREKFASK